MNPIQARVSAEAAAAIARTELGQEIGPLSPLENGPISTSYLFQEGERSLVIEFREPNMSAGLKRELFFGERFKELDIPTRRILSSGEHDGLRYVIHEREEGVPLAELPPQDFQDALPAVFEMLLRLSRTDISGMEGYGWMNDGGNGDEASWLAHLSKIKDEEPGFYFGEWHHYFDASFLERDRFYAYHAAMLEAMEGIDPPRCLAHGSFSTFNVLVNEKRISALRDWQDARLGDSLFDLACLDYWPTGADIPGRFAEFAKGRGIEYEGFERRLRAYKYFLSLGNMIYFAKIGDGESYRQVVGVAEAI